MKLACNWSNELQRLLSGNEVKVDYVKACVISDSDFKSLAEHVRRTHPILLHGLNLGESAGMDEVHKLDFDKINRLIDACASPHFGIHLSISETNMSDAAICNKMLANIEIFKKKIDVPLLVENVPDCNRDRRLFKHHPFINTELISRIINTADIGLIFDISHAKITCIYNNLDFYSYAKALPLERVRELHVNGSGFDDEGGIMDSHSAMREEDYKLLQWVLERTQPEILTLEYGWLEESPYGAELDMLRTTLHRLREILEKYKKVRI